jgi:hypothetical protein
VARSIASKLYGKCKGTRRGGKIAGLLDFGKN